MTAKHTEGPVLARSDGTLICGGRMIGRAHLLGTGHSREERDANAARLALCWNEHEGLVEVLERVLSVARAQRVTTVERIITGAPSNETLRADGAAVLADIEALLTRIREAQS